MKTPNNPLESLDHLPTSNVGDFIEDYAQQRGIEYKRSPIDDFAEKITSLSGDDVVLDNIEKLLVTLAKKNAITKRQMLRLQLNYTREKAENKRITRRQIERRIATLTIEILVTNGCTVTVIEDEKIILEDSRDPIIIEAAFDASGEAFLKAKRLIDGTLQEGWVEFLSHRGIEIVADENLNLYEALKAANELSARLGVLDTTLPEPPFE